MSVSTILNHKQGLMKKERLITIDELVEWLGFTKNQIYFGISEDRFFYMKIGRHLRFDPE